MNMETFIKTMTPREYRNIEGKLGVSFAKMTAENIDAIQFTVSVYAVMRKRENGTTFEEAYENALDVNMNVINEAFGIKEDDEATVVENTSDADEIMAVFSD